MRTASRWRPRCRRTPSHSGPVASPEFSHATRRHGIDSYRQIPAERPAGRSGGGRVRPVVPAPAPTLPSRDEEAGPTRGRAPMRWMQRAAPGRSVSTSARVRIAAQHCACSWPSSRTLTPAPRAMPGGPSATNNPSRRSDGSSRFSCPRAFWAFESTIGRRSTYDGVRTCPHGPGISAISAGAEPFP